MTARYGVVAALVASFEQRFWRQVDRNGPVSEYRPDLGPCWIWNGYINSDGYGSISFGARGAVAQMVVHRAAWELERGEIPPTRHLDHLCRVKRCVNPVHLEPVTQAVNNQRAWDALRSDYCPKGHFYDDANTYRKPSDANRRRCRTCLREQARAYHLKKKAAS